MFRLLQTTSMGEWIRKRFHAEVEAGVGAWSSAASPTLGLGVYEYKDEVVAVRLHEEGLAYVLADEVTELRYSEIHAVNVMPLTKLVRLHDRPKETVAIGLSCANGEAHLKIPMELYSELAPTLCGIVDRMQTA